MYKTRFETSVTVAIIWVLLLSPVLGQKRTEAPKKPAAPPVVEVPPTLDTLLSDDSYRVYFEVRNVGQVVRSTALTELVAPVRKLMGPMEEVETMLKWLTEHADQLAGSRLIVAAAPGRKLLPDAVVAIEFSSAEEAKKFQRQVRSFLPTLLPTPTPTPSPPTSSTDAPQATPTLPPPPHATQQVMQEGSMVLIADRIISLRDLKPRGAKLLVEDSNFNAIRSRFASEPLFLYINLASLIKAEIEQREKTTQEDDKQRQKALAEAGAAPSPEQTIASPETESTPDVPEIQDGPEPEESSELRAPDLEPTPSTTPALPEPARQPTVLDLTAPLLSALFTTVQPKWPDAIGAALVLDDDAYTLRVLTINSDDSKAIALPFLPQINSGPPITPAASAIFPANTQLFVTLSLDYRELYANLIKGLAMQAEQIRQIQTRVHSASPPDLPETSALDRFERDLGIRIKDDLLPVLGNEIALALTKPPPAPEPSPAITTNQSAALTKAPEPIPVVAVAIKDREAVKKLIGQLLERSGLKGANLIAQTERREDTELTAYGNFAAYAFIGDFIVVSNNAVVVRQVVDHYLTRQTLSSDSSFRAATQWQPRQVQGQVYVAPTLVEMYYPLKSSTSEHVQAMLARINSIDPLTYALTNDGLGPLHEMRVPRNLLMFLMVGLYQEDSERSLVTNESIARSVMATVSSAQATFKATKGDGRYGTLDELVNEKLLDKTLLENYGYRIEVSALAIKFEATATPVEYGKTGRMSFFIDDSGVLRAGDHAGGPATLADNPLDN